jgi:hypothetical protein
MSHGYWCNARTIPLKCKFCGASVFYFFCDCGSKVFFDELGEPWPLHFCQEYAKHLAAEESFEAKVILQKREVSWTLIGPDEEYELHIEHDYSNAVKRNRIEIEKKPNAIERVEATLNALVKPMGTVREVLGPIDLYRKFGIDTESLLGREFLGKLKDGEFVQVTIHATNYSKSNRLSYTFLVIKDTLEKEKVRVGETLTASLKGQHVKGQPYWHCIKMERID